jgi:hypothetical protein
MTATSVVSRYGLAPMTEIIESFATVNDDTPSTKKRIRRTGTSFKGMRLMNDSEREQWAIRLSVQRRLAIVIVVGIAVYSIGPTGGVPPRTIKPHMSSFCS